MVKKLTRRGAEAKSPVTASPVSFSQKVEYPDGLDLRVTNIKQGVVTGQGPGFLPGQPTTAFSVTLTNGSHTAVVLNQVVVTTTYGSPQRIAFPVYDTTSQDFSGTVKPGQDAKARYVFSVPKAALGDVTMTVDFDGLHASATFKGSAK